MKYFPFLTLALVLDICPLFIKKYYFFKDSGISQLSAGGGDGKNIDCTDYKGTEDINGVLSGRSSSVSSPTHRNLFSETSKNGLDNLTDDEYSKGEAGYESDVDMMASVISELNNADESRAAEKRAALTSLIRLARTGSTVAWNENFRAVLRILLEKLGSEDNSIRVLVLGVLTEMMRRCPLVQHFLNFSELIILRVLKCHADKSREVVRGAQVSIRAFYDKSTTTTTHLPDFWCISNSWPLNSISNFLLNRTNVLKFMTLVFFEGTYCGHLICTP